MAGIELRLECRCVQKCFHIWSYYVCCLCAPLLVLTQSKETVSWSNLVFFYNKILTKLFRVKYEKITPFWWVFSVVGAHNQQVFCMFKWGKKETKTTKGAHCSPISMMAGICFYRIKDLLHRNFLVFVCNCLIGSWIQCRNLLAIV